MATVTRIQIRKALFGSIPNGVTNAAGLQASQPTIDVKAEVSACSWSKDFNREIVTVYEDDGEAQGAGLPSGQVDFVCQETDSDTGLVGLVTDRAEGYNTAPYAFYIEYGGAESKWMGCFMTSRQTGSQQDARTRAGERRVSFNIYKGELHEGVTP